MATSPLFGWQEPDDTSLVKDGAAAIRTLGNAIDTSMGDLLGGTTGQVLAKASNTNMDFTWVAQDDSNAIQNAIVDAKGDLIAASAADTPARLAVGNNGETLVADSSTSTGLRWTKTQPNYANNGAFDFWQRGTSFTVTASNAYTADRFYCYAAGANATAARSTSVPTGSIAPYSLELTGATSQTLLEVGQRIESQYINALKTTVTFSAKVFNNTGAAFTPTIFIQTPTAVDNWAGVTTVVSGASLQSCADGAWTTVYYTADWSGYTNISNGAGIILEFNAAANGPSKKVRVTEWQVTPTPMIMPFQRSAATLQGELAACRRYLPAIVGGNGAEIGMGYAYGSNSPMAFVKFDVVARVNPTGITSAGNWRWYALNTGTVAGVSFNAANQYGATLVNTSGVTITAGQGTRLYGDDSSAIILFTGCEL